MHDRRRGAQRWRIVGAGLLALVVVIAVAGLLVVNDTPRGLVNFVPMPRRLRPLTQVDGLNYRIHAGLGTAFEAVGAPASATASEWFKGAYHARTAAQMARAANGLIAVRQRASSQQVEATLCPALGIERADGATARVQRQVEVLAMAGLSCEPATVG